MLINSMSIGMKVGKGAGLTLTQQAINVLRKPGLESHVYMPGVGWVNGLSLTNAIMADGSQPAVVDQPLGYLGDAAGDTPVINATQATTANKPILRRGAVNRLLWSRDLRASTGAWTNGDTTVTKDQAGYDGAVNGACLLTQGSAGTAAVVQNRSIPSAALTYTDTWYLKRGNTDWVRITNNTNGPDGRALWVNLATGALGVHSAIGLGTGTASIEDAGNGFWRVRLTVTPNGSGTTKSTQIYAVTADGVTTRVTGGTFIADAVQSETGATANSYIPTTTAAASSPTGPYWMEFDGTDFLSLAAVPFQQADNHCVIAAFANQKATGAGIVFAVAGSGVQRVAQIYLINGQVQASWVDDAGTTVNFPGPTPALGAVAVASVRRSGAQRLFRVNGVQYGANGVISLGATTTDSQVIGAHKSTPANFMIGAIFSAIVIRDVGGVLTDADVSILERYVAQASGVTL